MSDYERNKGKLIPVHIDLENYTEDDFDTLYDNGMVIIDGEVYEVVWEVKGETDETAFADVKVNEDGSIDFHTYHYNGVAYWTEVVENALDKDNEPNL